MKSCEVGEQGWERVWFVEVGGWRPIIEEGDGEIEVGERHGGEGFYEDVDYDIGVIEVLVELVAEWQEDSI